ncbi:MAG: translation initiation factor IF-2 [Oculatellaceae cyanobacterium Prado106]|jgi:translation initiation factor IF-2|nr:translation initiation factor IF-2 [Oculatellaceae cyanobacterium Prado106]
MNNGKVRIYELSKELNLDNKDILTVCDKLNISVKSHSSTITEEEAGRIRAAAEKYTPSPAGKPASHHSSSHANGAPVKTSGVKPPVKKQQILEIRRTRPLAEPPRRPEVESPAPSAPAGATPSAAPQQSAPAQPPARLNTPPAAPNAPSRPSSDVLQDEEMVSPIEAIDATDATTDVTEVIGAADAVDTTIDGLTDAPESPVEVAPAPEPVAAVSQPAPAAPPTPPALEPPPAPPTRPMIKVTDVPATPPPSNRPTLKKDRGEAAGQPVGRGNGRPEGAPTREGGVRRSDGAAGGDGVQLKPKPVIELRRKPTRPGEGGTAAPGAAAPGTEGATTTLDLELRRPTPPRPPKRGKGWEEEEEEEESKAKAAGGVKTKRRSPVIDDEEELIDEVLFEDDENDDEDSPVQVSLSLARPPKPKSKPGQAKPAVASFSPPKSKRSSEGSSRGFRRDRRQEEVRQRPEQITLTGSLSVHDLADLLVAPETELIRVLFMKGIAANINQILDIPTASMVAEEFSVVVETGEAEAEAKKVTEMLDAADLENLQRRPPVVTIMGHVDHGKTTLLDSIRKTKVAQGEAGGITQHIGAYHVDVEMNDQTQQVVFLDTPGHEAFTAMRARGARVTDIAILVVAADDGVRPQSIEAISHAKAAGVPIIVAINKVDKEEAQPDRVKQELTEYGLLAEEWGGDTIMVPVSAIKGENLDSLLEMILLVAEVEDLYANPDRTAKGTVIEANLDKSRGPVATLIVQNGTLKVGDTLVAGSVFGKVRAMIDDRGKRVDVAGPSFAVEVLGLGDVPAAGDEFEVYRDEKEARSIASDRTDAQRLSRLQQAMASRRVSLNTISAQAQEGELKELNLILKADVQGSVEAILGALQQLPQKEVQVRVLLAAPGEITETDVDLAAASSAVIVGFNTTLASGARQAADTAGVDVRDYNIIYKLLEDIQGAMEGLLDPEMVEEPLGQVEVRAVFPVGRGTVAGCYVLSGKIIRNSRVRVRRGNEVVHEGNLDSLKRMKEDTREVNAGYECGIGLDNFKNWVEGDIIEVFRLVSKRRTLSA